MKLICRHHRSLQEEEKDEEWESSDSESEDEPDTDFDEPVSIYTCLCDLSALPRACAGGHCLWLFVCTRCSFARFVCMLLHDICAADASMQEGDDDDEEKDGEPKERRQEFLESIMHQFPTNMAMHCRSCVPSPRTGEAMPTNLIAECCS